MQKGLICLVSFALSLRVLAALDGVSTSSSGAGAGDVYLASNNTYSAGTTQTFETVEFTGNAQIGMPTGSDIEIGYDLNTLDGVGIFIGENVEPGSTSRDDFDVRIGKDISSNYDNSVMIGNSIAGSGDSIIIGNAISGGNGGNGENVCIGNSIDLTSARLGAIAIGNDIVVSKDYGVLIGKSSYSDGQFSIGIGRTARTRGTHSISIGYLAGQPNPNTTGHDFSVGIGDQANYRSSYALTLGAGSWVTANYANSIGYQTSNSVSHTTHIGSNARTHLLAGSDANTNSYIKTDSQIVGTESWDSTTPDETAKGRSMVSLNITTNATVTDLYLDAGNFEAWGTTNTFVSGSELITIPSNTIMRYRVEVVGVEEDTGTLASYKLEGAIANQAGTTALKGAITKLTDFEDDTAWDATIIADDTNDALAIRVTGTATNTIRWVARTETTEVGY